MSQSRNVRSRCRCSVCPAIHINSRSWLRSSSTHEPSDPPHRVVFVSFEQVSTQTPATGVVRLRPGSRHADPETCVQSRDLWGPSGAHRVCVIVLGRVFGAGGSLDVCPGPSNSCPSRRVPSAPYLPPGGLPFKPASHGPRGPFGSPVRPRQSPRVRATLLAWATGTPIGRFRLTETHVSRYQAKRCHAGPEAGQEPRCVQKAFGRDRAPCRRRPGENRRLGSSPDLCVWLDECQPCSQH